MAQSGERLNGIEEVGGSTPPSSTRLDEIKNFHFEIQAGTIESWVDPSPRYVINAGGSSVRQLTDNPEWDGYPAWSPH